MSASASFFIGQIVRVRILNGNTCQAAGGLSKRFQAVRERGLLFAQPLNQVSARAKEEESTRIAPRRSPVLPYMQSCYSNSWNGYHTGQRGEPAKGGTDHEYERHQPREVEHEADQQLPRR